MAKRYLDTSFFKSPFVRGLKGPLKTLYGFIICDCSGAGIWVKDLEAAGMYCDAKFTEKDFEAAFVDRRKAIDLGDGRYFFPDFIEHQYPEGLQENNRAHKNFITELLKYNLLDEELRPIKAPLKPLARAQGLGNGNGNSHGNGLGNGNGQAEKKIEVTMPYQSEAFAAEWNTWKQYRKEQHRFVYKPISEQAALIKLTKLARDETTAIAVIRQSIENSWKGFFELKENGQQAGSNQNRNSKVGQQYDRSTVESNVRKFFPPK